MVFCTESVFITPIGSPIAGETYSLECSAGAGLVVTFQWLGPPDGVTPVVHVNTSSITVSSNSTTSQLQFRPLQQSQNGSYSCLAVTNDDTWPSQPVEIRVGGNHISL